MQLAQLRGIARSQGQTRAVIHDVAQTLKPGVTERAAAERIESGLLRAGVRCWLHTPYAWFGERTRFAGFDEWEPDALPTERRLEPGEPYILDAAPFVDGHPSDYALSGVLGGEHPEHARMLESLRRLKPALAGWARDAPSGRALFETVAAAMAEAGFEAVHPRYPGAVLGHAVDALPAWLQRLPRLGWGFQPPLVAGYAIALLRHALAGASYPFVNPHAEGPPRGVIAFEPHLASGDCGAKFESILVVDGDETRWLDAELFGPAET